MEDIITEDTFHCWVPATTLSKSGDKKDSGDRIIQGIASTSSTDLQGESVDPVGIDFNYFQTHGYFNDDHKQGNEFRVGQPLECKITKNGLWVKGKLFKQNKRADIIWDFMNSLEASESTRKMGFSIEGKVKRRNGNKIEKCWVQNVAITAQPVNTQTWAEIVKSLCMNTETEKKALEAGTDSPLAVESLDGKKKETVSKSFDFKETVSVLKEEYGIPADSAETVAKLVFAMIQ